MGKDGGVTINVKLGKVSKGGSFATGFARATGLSKAIDTAKYKLSGQALLDDIKSQTAKAKSSMSLSTQVGNLTAKLDSTAIGKAFKAYNKVINEVGKIQAQCDKALSRTVNDMKSRAPAQVTKAVRQVYGISAATMKEEGDKAKRQAGGTTGTVRLVYSGRPLTPTHFKMKPTTLPTKRATDTVRIPGQNIKTDKAVGDVAIVNPLAPYQVSAEIYKGKRTVFPGQTFLGTNKGTGYIPYQREGDGRTPIKALKTVSIPQMIENEEVTEILGTALQELLEKRLDHNIDKVMK